MIKDKNLQPWSKQLASGIITLNRLCAASHTGPQNTMMVSGVSAVGFFHVVASSVNKEFKTSFSHELQVHVRDARNDYVHCSVCVSCLMIA